MTVARSRRTRHFDPVPFISWNSRFANAGHGLLSPTKRYVRTYPTTPMKSIYLFILFSSWIGAILLRSYLEKRFLKFNSKENISQFPSYLLQLVHRSNILFNWSDVFSIFFNSFLISWMMYYIIGYWVYWIIHFIYVLYRCNIAKFELISKRKAYTLPISFLLI